MAVPASPPTFMLLLPIPEGQDPKNHLGLMAILERASERGEHFRVDTTTVVANVQQGVNLVQVLLAHA